MFLNIYVLPIQIIIRIDRQFIDIFYKTFITKIPYNFICYEIGLFFIKAGIIFLILMHNINCKHLTKLKIRGFEGLLLKCQRSVRKYNIYLYVKKTIVNLLFQNKHRT